MQQPIPFLPNQQSGFESLAGPSPSAINVVFEPDGSVRRRPGITTFSSGNVDSAGISGIHATVDGRIYVVSDTDNARALYRLSTAGVVTALSTATDTDTYMDGSARPTFAETEAMVAIAGGYSMHRIYRAGDVSNRLSASAPLASHVIANNARLMANDATVDKSYLFYTGQAAGSATSPHEDWTVSAGGGAGQVVATSRPDPVVALGENSSEVFAFGSTSLQIYGLDGTTDYAPIGTREYGCIAPYSVVKADGSFFWLDQLRRFVQSDGRGYEVISTSMKATLDAMTTVSDCFGYRVIVGGVDVICFCFPTDGRTLAYQIGGGWSTWMGWSDVTSNYTRLGINAACVNPATGRVLVGMTSGMVGTMSRSALTDLDSPIVASVTTGYQSRGTDARKLCRAVRLVFRRGETLLDDEPVALLSWRDDGGPWGATHEVGLGVSGDYDPVVELRSLGVYRRREWKLEFSGAEDIVLVSATEDFEIVVE